MPTRRAGGGMIPEQQCEWKAATPVTLGAGDDGQHEDIPHQNQLGMA